MSSGILDDLTFEDLVKGRERFQEYSDKVIEKGVDENTKEIILCEFDNKQSCDEKCKYFKSCTRRPDKNSINSASSKIVTEQDKQNKPIENEDFYNWLRKDGFSMRVIDMYKEYAYLDKRVFEIETEEELFQYVEGKMKEYSGNKRNFYKYYLKFFESQKS